MPKPPKNGDLVRGPRKKFLADGGAFLRPPQNNNGPPTTQRVAGPSPPIRGKSRRGKNASTALIWLIYGVPQASAAPPARRRLGRPSQPLRSLKRERSPNQVRSTRAPLSLCYSALWERSFRSFCCFWTVP